MKTIKKESLPFWAIFVILIALTVGLVLQYEDSPSRRFLIFVYGATVMFGLILAIRLHYWTLCILTCLLVSSMPLMEALVFLPRIHESNIREALVLHGDQGIFTTGGTPTVTLFGFIIPLILVGIKGINNHYMKKAS